MEIEDQLGAEYPGVIISDDLNVYNGYPYWLNKNAWPIYVARSQKLIKTPGQNNKSIGKALTELVDEGFKQHSLWRSQGNNQDYFHWAAQFKTKVKLTLQQWSQKAGYEAGKLLRNLKLKADQWWYFLDYR